MRSVVRKRDIAARFGRDEFTLLAEDIPDIGAAARIAEKVLEFL